MLPNPAVKRDAPPKSAAPRPLPLRWTSLMKLLLTLILLLLVSPVMSQSFERTTGIIGILPLPEVFGIEPCANFVPQDIPIFGTPVSSPIKSRCTQPIQNYSVANNIVPQYSP